MNFTQEQFFQMLTKYHNAIWPIPSILFFVGIVVIAALLSRWHLRRSIVLGALSFLWLWCGTIFLSYFCSGYIPHTTFVPQAFLFSLEGVLFMITAVRLKECLDFNFSRSSFEVIGIVVACVGLIAWPLIGNISGHFYPAAPVFGEPCPLTIFTFGILLCSKSRVPWYLVVIPFIWSLTGLFGLIPEDYIELFVGVSGTATILIRNRNLRRKAVA